MKRHYVYRITRKMDLIKYIGVRSCLGNPEDDLGYVYFSSSHDEDFMNEQKENSNNFIYEIITESPDRKTANEFEVMLHRILNVAKSPEYFNKARATSSGFCTEGKELTDEHKEKLSRVGKGRVVSEETCKKLSILNLGRKHTKEHRENNSKARLGEKHHLWGTKRSQEIRDKISGENHHMWGKTHPEETIAKISDSIRGKVSARYLVTGQTMQVTKEEFDSTELLVGIASKKPNIFDSINNNKRGTKCA